MVIDYRDGGEILLNRSTWRRKDLQWLLEMIKKNAPDATVAKSAETWWRSPLPTGMGSPR
jgi:hypothetical protein